MIKQIAYDTLKHDGKWSRTSLTMFSAWVWVIVIATIDYIQHGFHFEVWITMVCVALGIKIANSYSKKIDPEIKEK